MNFKYIPASPANYTANRAANGGAITKITLHHMAGFLSIDQLGTLWQNSARQGSSHYGINGWDVGQYVKEEDIAWTDSNWESNKTSITIEVANSGGAPDWPVSAESLETTAQLCADVGKRNGLGNLVPGQNLTWHQMYASTACPGPFLLASMQAIANRANEINAPEPAPVPTPEPVDPFPSVSNEQLAARVWAGEFGNGDARKAALGTRYAAVQALVDQGVGKPAPAPVPAPAPAPAENKLAIGREIHLNGSWLYADAHTDHVSNVLPDANLGVVNPFYIHGAEINGRVPITNRAEWAAQEVTGSNTTGYISVNDVP